LIVREDNADLRLGEMGYEIGLLSKKRFQLLEEKKKEIAAAFTFLRTKRIKPNEKINTLLRQHGHPELTQAPSAEEFLRRPNVDRAFVETLLGETIPGSEKAVEQATIQVKYAGYIERQMKDVEKFRDLEKVKIPADFIYTDLSGLSKEIQEKLTRIRPVSLGQASRISGVTPAAIMLLMIHLKKSSSQTS